MQMGVYVIQFAGVCRFPQGIPSAERHAFAEV